MWNEGQKCGGCFSGHGESVDHPWTLTSVPTGVQVSMFCCSPGQCKVNSANSWFANFSFSCLLADHSFSVIWVLFVKLEINMYLLNVFLASQIIIIT